MPAISLDNYADTHNLKPNSVKIDAEGTEFEVLLGVEKLLCDACPVVSIEVSDFDIEGTPTSADLVRHLMKRKYRCLEHVDGAFRTHKIRESYGYNNLFFCANLNS